MQKLSILVVCGTLLSACGVPSGNDTIFLDDGKDTSFLKQGSLTCPANTVQAGLSGSTTYPLRCGPQAQVIPR